MDLYIYADESGVFDSKHNDFFIYAGVLFVGKDEKDDFSRLFSAAERRVRNITGRKGELKACRISSDCKIVLYKSLNRAIKFGVIINQKKLNQNIFENKKHKQRYLDYAFKMSLKILLKELIRRKIILENEIENIYVFPDEHATATDGRYELEEGLYNEFKNGTFNMNYNIYYEPILPKIKGIYVRFCDSASVILVRAADIVANKIFHLRVKNLDTVVYQPNLFITYLP